MNRLRLPFKPVTAEPPPKPGMTSGPLTVERIDWLAECLRRSDIDPDARQFILRIIHDWSRTEQAMLPQKRGRKVMLPLILAHVVADLCERYKITREAAMSLVRDVAGGAAKRVSDKAIISALERLRKDGRVTATELTPADGVFLYKVQSGVAARARELKLRRLISSLKRLEP